MARLTLTSLPERLALKSLVKLGVASALLLASGCVYRFTNLHVRRPGGVQSIAVEGIYDTSRTVLPHEVLWSELQRAFAADGHLRVVRQSEADALLRAHIRTADITPSGTITSLDANTLNDADVYKQDPVPLPNQIRDLPVAREVTTYDNLHLVVNIEIWDLKTNRLLFSHDYSLAQDFRSLRTPEIAPLTGHYLRYEEALDASFQRLSQSIASDVVQEFLVTL